MPMYKCSHNENRKKICALCGRKINLGEKTLDNFRITEYFEKLIKEFIKKNFNLLNEKYPISVYTKCHFTL